MDLISKKTRTEFRDSLAIWTLQNIHDEFDAADIKCDENYDPKLSTQRRSLVEQYYATLDFSQWNDVRKLLKVYASLMAFHEQSITDEVSLKIISTLSKLLAKDGFNYRNDEIVPTSGASALKQALTISFELNTEYMQQQIRRIEDSVVNDPILAIGSAKELVETCCKTILRERKNPVPNNENWEISKLVKETCRELKLLPENVSEQAKGSETIKRMLSNLGNLTQGLAELRNLYGSGHGKDGKTIGVHPRHARLAVNSASTLVVFLFETHLENAPE